MGREPSGGGAQEQSVEHRRAQAGARSLSCRHGGRRRPKLSRVVEEARLLPAGMQSVCRVGWCLPVGSR